MSDGEWWNTDAALKVWCAEAEPPYAARARDYLGDATFAEASPEALAALREADREADAKNRDLMSRAIAAALGEDSP